MAGLVILCMSSLQPASLPGPVTAVRKALISEDQSQKLSKEGIDL